jgi:YVTN family beta-propeller protein
VARPVKVGAFPSAVAITPDGSTAYVASSLPNIVTPIQTATNTAGTPIHAGTFPLAIAFISG